MKAVDGIGNGVHAGGVRNIGMTFVSAWNRCGNRGR
jgi:hypothetical protein